MRKALLPLLAALAVPAAAQQAVAPFTVQETGQAFTDLQEAVNTIGEGQGTILIAPGTYRQCAVQEAGRIAYVAREPGGAVFDGTICEDKAALVLRGRAARIEGLVFQNMAAADGNGAAIRIQEGDLDVRESLFRNSETAILSHDDASSAIRIAQSTFSENGRCRPDNCSHSVYIGPYGSLSVVRSRFERGRGGHYLKSRSGRIEVRESSFDDSGGRDTSYMIDLPGGATGTIAGNAFVQGANKQNYTALIVVQAEGARHSSQGLNIADNEASTAPGFDQSTSFIADYSGANLRVENNRLGQRIRPFERR